MTFSSKNTLNSIYFPQLNAISSTNQGPISENFKINFEIKINFNSIQVRTFKVILELQTDIRILVVW